MEHSHVHAAVEIVDKGGEVVEQAESTGKIAKAITASEAFRKYDWLKGVPITNASGNLRGMVLSARWRGAYGIALKYGAVLEKCHLGSFASIAVGIADSSEEIGDILNSKDSWDIKGAKLSTQATAIAMSVLTGVVTAPTHAVFMSLQGYCNIVDLAKGNQIGTCGRTLKAMDVSIQSAAKQVSDGNNIYIFVNTTITPKVSKALGF